MHRITARGAALSRAGIAGVAVRSATRWALLVASAAVGCAGTGAEPKPVPVVVVAGAEPACADGMTWDGARCARKRQDDCDAGASDPNGECAQRRPKSTIAADLPIAVLIRDPRPARLRPRPAALLDIEAQSVEKLLETMKVSSPDHPRLLRRLGDAYVELSYALLEAHGRREAVADAAAKGIKVYERFIADHASAPDADVVTYSLGLEYERADRVNDARKAYLSLIQKWPSSSYIPLAYLAFGEYFLAEAAGDPSKLPLAQQAYQEVIKFPPPANRAFAYAHYKLAQVFRATTDFAQALGELKKTIEASTADAESPAAAQLAEAARVDIIAVYSLVGAATKAYSFFRSVSGDEPGKDDRTLFMLADLGAEYGRAGSAPEAIAVFDDLLGRAGTRLCAQKPQIVGALGALDTPSSNAAARADIARISRAFAQRCP